MVLKMHTVKTGIIAVICIQVLVAKTELATASIHIQAGNTSILKRLSLCTNHTTRILRSSECFLIPNLHGQHHVHTFDPWIFLPEKQNQRSQSFPLLWNDNDVFLFIDISESLTPNLHISNSTHSSWTQWNLVLYKLQS